MGSHNTQDFSHLQDILGTIPHVKRYIVLSLFFALDDSIASSQIETELRNALTRLVDAFPWFEGHVVWKGRDQSKNRSGVPKVIPSDEALPLIVNDLRHDESFPSLSEIRNAKYPFSVLDMERLAPPLAASWSSGGFDQIAPVLMLQATLIRGGLILTVCGNHTQMDMTGMGLIISSLAKACEGQSYTEDELRQGNQPRGDAVPLLDEAYQPGSDLDDMMVIRADADARDPFAVKPLWQYFHFSASNLAALKSEASKQTISPYVSTDDSIAALCWQRLSHARSTTLGPTGKTTFCRPISVRKYLGLQGYIGHMADCVFDTATCVHERSLGDIAGRLRQKLNQDERIIHHVRAFATVLNRLEDKSQLVNGARLDPERDLVLSSYANIKCCDLRFGPILGWPEAARRPKMPPWPSLFYLMPKDRDGSIAVAFCLGEAEMQSLKKDEILAKYAEFIG